MSACSAFKGGASLCANGFPVNSACSGYTCHSCGQHTQKQPACMREDWDEKAFRVWFDESGKPKNYQPDTTESGK